jgi:hypothetical protein
MEGKLAGLFEGLRRELDLRKTRVETECRASSCRVSFRFDSSDVLRSQQLGAGHPQLLMIERTGVWASLVYEVPPEGDRAVAYPDPFVFVTEDGGFAKTMILAFGPEEIEPTGYDDWLAHQRANLERLREGAASGAGQDVE